MKTEMNIKQMQKFIATISNGPSTLRGQGKGILKITHNFCAKLDLKKYTNTNKIQFHKQLDKDTHKLLNEYNLKQDPWGTARKAINIFLRDVVYNKYLSSHYKLTSIESYMEVPLDSIVAKKLREYSKKVKCTLPPWKGLKYLTKDTNTQYQTIAQELANKRKIARIHLDITLWTENRLPH